MPGLPDGLAEGSPEGCCGRCRAVRSRQRKAEARRARDEQIRTLLEAALMRLRDSP